MSRPICVTVLLDDESLWRQGITAIFERADIPDMPFYRYERPQEFFREMERDDKHIVILDNTLKNTYGQHDGLSVLKHTMEIQPDARVIIISADDSVSAKYVGQPGVFAFLHKNADGFGKRLREEVEIQMKAFANSSDSLTKEEKKTLFKRLWKGAVWLIRKVLGWGA